MRSLCLWDLVEVLTSSTKIRLLRIIYKVRTHQVVRCITYRAHCSCVIYHFQVPEFYC